MAPMVCALEASSVWRAERTAESRIARRAVSVDVFFLCGRAMPQDTMSAPSGDRALQVKRL